MQTLFIYIHDCVNGCRETNQFQVGKFSQPESLFPFRKMLLNVKITLQTQGFQSPPEGEIDYDVRAQGLGGPSTRGIHEQDLWFC